MALGQAQVRRLRLDVIGRLRRGRHLQLARRRNVLLERRRRMVALLVLEKLLEGVVWRLREVAHARPRHVTGQTVLTTERRTSAVHSER